MERKAKNGWMAALLALALASAAHGAMVGIGREGEFVLEVFAEHADVEREKDTAAVTLPKDAEALFRAADLREGDSVWTGSEAPWKALGTVVSFESGWWKCTLKLKEPVHPEPAMLERFHLLRWKVLGERFTARLDGLAKTNGAAFQAGLASVLEGVGTVFGGESMVAGFPGTKYEAEFRKVQRAFERCARRGCLRGFSADRGVQSRYREIFGGDWPTGVPGTFSAGNGQVLEIVRVTDAEGRPVPDAFQIPLPVRLEGNSCAEGVFPAGETVRITYAAAGGGKTGERTFSWAFPASGGLATWFVLAAPPTDGPAVLSTNLLENAGAVPVAAKVIMKGTTQSYALPAGGKAMLCLLMRQGESPRLNGVPAPSNAYARDWDVVPRMDAPGHIRFDATRKATPGLVLNNPEMMPVDVTIMPAGGGMGSRTKLTLQAGETGVGIPVPAHKVLQLSYRFRSDFHKAGQMEIPPLFHGDRSNLVLRAELKGNPEVSVQNTGPVAVRLSGMAGPTGEVVIQPGKSTKVTVPPGKRTLLTGTPIVADYSCEPVSVPAMAPGDATAVKLRMALKAAPQVVLRNAHGMMDVEATLMSLGGKALAKPVSIKKGATARPMTLPAMPGLYFRLVYRYNRFTAEGRLAVPDVPRGQVHTIDIPNPESGIRVQSTDAPVEGKGESRPPKPLPHDVPGDASQRMAK